jgi:ABC-type transporter Mla MlaB component
VWLWAIPAAGAIVCLAWVALLTSYRKLNRAKFTVLTEIEADLPVPLFTREREAYRRDQRWSLSNIERLIPACFALLYAVMLVAAVVTRGS